MQVTKITERQPPRTPPRKVKEEPPKPINKQQFHIDPNLEKGIDCSFEALGSSEGRHSVNESTPPGSMKHNRRVRPRQRFSSSVVDEHESHYDGRRVEDVETVARLSRQNLNFGSNISEMEDEPNDQIDRLQSIFSMNKKESDLQEKLKSGVLFVKGSKTDVFPHTLKPNRSKDLHFRRTMDLDSTLRGSD